MGKNKEVLFDPVFIISLVLLALNDHVLKYFFHNRLTGKLSDIAGLIVLPVFISFLFPRLSRLSCTLSAIFFIYWKTELSDTFIELLNRNGILTFHRIIDFTDFIALLILPLSWNIVNRKMKTGPKVNTTGAVFIIVITFIVLTATSIAPVLSIKPEGTILVNQKHRLRVPKDSVLAKIEQLGYSYEFSDDYYRIHDIAVPRISKGRQFEIREDTIKELTFSFIDFPYQPTKRQQQLGAQYLYIHEVKFSNQNTITDWRLMKRLSKIYGDVSKELFVKKSTRK